MGFQMQRPGWLPKVARAARWLALGSEVAGLSWAGYAGVAWVRYGRRTKTGEADRFLDRFMPEYGAAVRHQTQVAAPAAVTFAAISALDLRQSKIAGALF